MSEDKERPSRRDFLKLAVLGTAAGVVAIKGTEAARERKWDLRNEDNLRRFLKEDELFEGYHAYFEGEVKLVRGARIYDEPRSKRETSQLDSTNIGKDTFILSIDDVGDVFSVKRPFLFLKEAEDDLGEAVEVEGPDGETKRVDLDQSWIIFEPSEDMPEGIRRDIERSMWGVGCVNIGSRKTLSFNPEGITFKKEISFGE